MLHDTLESLSHFTSNLSQLSFHASLFLSDLLIKLFDPVLELSSRGAAESHDLFFEVLVHGRFTLF